MTAYTDSRVAYAALLLRLLTGVAFVAHGLILKVFIFGMPNVVVAFEQYFGFPGWLAWPTMLAETLGGLLLILGIHVRLVSLGLIAVLLGAAWVHSGNGWVFSNPNGGWEYPVFWAVVQGAVALLGPGAHAAPVSLLGRKAA